MSQRKTPQRLRPARHMVACLTWFLAPAVGLQAAQAQAQTSESAAASQDDDRQEAFLALPAVLRGLRAIDMARTVMPARPESSMDSLQAACWRAVSAKPDGAGIDRIDDCLSAAAQDLSPDLQYRRELEVLGKPGLAGVGIVIKAESEQPVMVVDVIPDSPAAVAGVRFGERLVAVDGQPSIGRPIDEVTGRVRGARGSAVSLTLRDQAGRERTVSLQRDAISTKPAYAQLVADALYLQVRSFPVPEGQSGAVLNHLESLIRPYMSRRPEPRILVLDLRGNRGGLAQAVLNMSTLFTQDPGSTMATLGAYGLRYNQPEESADEQVHAWLRKRPLVVLTDKETSSGTEWLVEALRRQTDAVIVGEATPGAIVVNTAHFIDRTTWVQWPAGFMLADGGSLAKDQGVRPDAALSASQLADWHTGVAPAWLEGWLKTEWPNARAEAVKRRQAVPEVWPLPAAPQGMKAMCVGAAQAYFPVSNGGRLMPLEGYIQKEGRWRLSVEAEADAGQRKVPGPLPGPSMGAMQARVHAGKDWHFASWRQDGLRYELVAELPESAKQPKPAQLLTIYQGLLNEFQLLVPDAMPSEPALCLGHVWAPLSARDTHVDWHTAWLAKEGEHRTAWSFDGAYQGGVLKDKSLGPDAQRGADRTEAVMEDDRHGCGSRQMPTVSSLAQGGSEWLTVMREGFHKGMNQVCEHRASTLLSPRYPSLGWSLKASYTRLGSATKGQGGADDAADKWLAVLKSVRVAPLGQQPGAAPLN